MESVASQFEPLVETGPATVTDERYATLLAQAAAEGRYLRVRNWVSRLLPTPRDLFVYLPELYLAEPDRAFPLLLLHGGQNVFDGGLSYVKGSSWQAGSTADSEIAAGSVEPVILAAVGNTGTERMAEYTPTPDRRLGGGKGPMYARLLVEEVLPMLRDRFRILPDAASTGLAGSSLGGLISPSIAMRFPHIFGLAGVLSPSIWWDHRTLLKDVRSLPEHIALRLWLDMGTAEGWEHVRDADMLAKLLESKGWREGIDLQYRRVPGAAHNEAAWAARFGEVLRFLYPAAR